MKEYFPNIKKFNEDNIRFLHFKIPNPIPKELYEELYNKGVFSKKDLVKNKYYLGKCRHAKIAKWDGNKFIYIRNKFGFEFPEDINHIEDDNGYDLFIPIKEIQPNENQIINN